MKTETEIVAGLISALETTRIELIMLFPRLGGEYQRNVKGATDKAKTALEEAKEFYNAREEQ